MEKVIAISSSFFAQSLDFTLKLELHVGQLVQDHRRDISPSLDQMKVALLLAAGPCCFIEILIQNLI